MTNEYKNSDRFITPRIVDVATHFDISHEASKLAIEYWIQKGRVEEQGAACGRVPSAKLNNKVHPPTFE